MYPCRLLNHGLAPSEEASPGTGGVPQLSSAEVVTAIEREFWRSVDAGTPQLVVEYANDHDIRRVGSGFARRDLPLGAPLPGEAGSARATSAGLSSPNRPGCCSAAAASQQVDEDGGDSAPQATEHHRPTHMGDDTSGSDGLSSVAARLTGASTGGLKPLQAVVPPRFEDAGYYRDCGWNLNNLPLVPGSVLRHVNEEINGINVPWLYMGMLFCAFCWHTEDNFLYSMNYMHAGDSKTWYGIPSVYATDFERVAASIIHERAKKEPDLLQQASSHS